MLGPARDLPAVFVPLRSGGAVVSRVDTRSFGVG
jgi:hypothetical protein